VCKKNDNTWYDSATPEVLELILQEHILGAGGGGIAFRSNRHKFMAIQGIRSQDGCPKRDESKIRPI